MDRIADIAVIVDPTADSHPAVSKAAALARALNARIELVVCDTRSLRQIQHSRRAADPARHAFIVGPQPLLDELAAPLRAAAIDVTTHIISGGRLHERVLEWLHGMPVDLVVKDTHHHPLLARALTAGSDYHLIRDCPLPLLLSKPRPWNANPILAAAIDPGHRHLQAALLERRILDCAASLAKAMTGQLHVVNAYFPTVMAAAIGPRARTAAAPPPEMLAVERGFHRAKIAGLVARYEIPDNRLHVDMGLPTEYLPRIAMEYNIDVMVMGVLSRGHLRRAIIGNTAEHVLDDLQCDVLVVKSSKFGGPAI